jgi:hypothetical protein
VVRLAVWVFTTLLILAPLAKSQQPVSPKATPDSEAATPPEPGEQDSNASIQQQAPNFAAAQGGFVRLLGSADELVEEGGLGLFHWGPFSLRSFSVLELVGQQTLDNPASGQPSTESGSSTQLSALIVFDKAVKRTRVTLQYQPQAFVTNGNFYANLANQNSSVDVTFPLNERWSLTVGDRFYYYASQRVYSGVPINTNYFNGITFLNNYTSGAGSTLTNSLYLALTYQWSPRATLSFTPGFGYSYSTGYEYATVGSEGSSPQRVSSLSGGGSVSFGYQVTEQANIGVSYFAQQMLFSNTSKTAGPQQSNLLQQDFLFMYRQQFRPTFWLNAGVGVLGSTTNNSGASWGLNIGVIKAFQHQSLTFAFNRGFQFNGLVNGYASDRVDAVHSISWTQRLSTSTSAAYFRYINGTPNTESGFYATEQLQYRLTPQMSFSGAFSYTKQVGDGVYLQSGNLHFFTVGFVWSPDVVRQP